MRQLYKPLIALTTGALTFAVLMLIQLYQGMVLNQRVSNGYYSAWAVSFETPAGWDAAGVLPVGEGLAVYRKVSTVDMRVVRCTGTYTPPPLVSGRFFEETDFFGDSRVAVAGRSVKIKTDELGSYIQVNGERYTVVGTMGYGKGSSLDRSVFLALNDENREWEGIFTVDGNRQAAVDRWLEAFTADMERMDFSRMNAERLIGLDDSGLPLIGGVLLFLLVSCLLLTLYWIKKSETEFYVSRMVGLPRFPIVRSLLRRLYGWAGAGYAVGLLLYIAAAGTGWLPGSVSLIAALPAAGLLLFLAVQAALLLFAFFARRGRRPLAEQVK